MKKNVLSKLAILIVVTLGMASCSREYHPQFAAGRFHHHQVNNQTSYEAFQSPQQTERINMLPSKAPQELLTASSDVSVQLQPVTKPVKLSLSTSKLQNKMKVTFNSNRQTYVVAAEIKPLSPVSNESKGQTGSRGRFDSDMRILCAVIAFFIPPLGVALYEKAITINFWVDLILTLLFWLPGFIFALIVILA